jgi:hypothetical protein
MFLTAQHAVNMFQPTATVVPLANTAHDAAEIWLGTRSCECVGKPSCAVLAKRCLATFWNALYPNVTSGSWPRLRTSVIAHDVAERSQAMGLTPLARYLQHAYESSPALDATKLLSLNMAAAIKLNNA